MGLGSFLSKLPIVGDVFGGLTGETQAEAARKAAGLDSQLAKTRAESMERMFDKQLERDKENIAALKAQAQAALKAQAAQPKQVGPIAYPSLIKTMPEKPSVLFPVLIVGGSIAWIYLRKKGGVL